MHPPSVIRLTCNCSLGLRSCTSSEVTPAIRELYEWYGQPRCTCACNTHCKPSVGCTHTLSFLFLQLHCAFRLIRWQPGNFSLLKATGSKVMCPSHPRSSEDCPRQQTGREDDCFVTGTCSSFFFSPKKVPFIPTAAQRAFYCCVQEAPEFLSHWLEQGVCNLITFRVAAKTCYTNWQEFIPL